MQKKRLLNSLFYSVLAATLLVFLSNYRVYSVSKEFIFDDLNELPRLHTALLLGTSKTLKNGQKNQYFDNRVTACLELYLSKKIKYILISGDNSRKEYNEPEDMKQALIQRGVPANRIYLDYAGFDTYDSVLRADKIFGQTQFIVVSQKFHNQRAVYIARKNGLKAYGYNAKDVVKMAGLKTKFREYFACVKAYVEVKLNVKPTYLGEKVLIR